jgi:Type I phosphodiesterase / nucleotide pyrophosphatase
MRIARIVLIYYLFLLILLSCKTEPVTNLKYVTENVIILVMDGPRYSETWGDSSHKFIPRMSNDLFPKGVINTRFFNTGKTTTIPGHTAIMTGVYQEIDNSGKELPQNPSVFQYWQKQFSQDSLASWVIASKDKLEVLSDSRDLEWGGKFNTSTNCGVNGLGTGYRADSITQNNALAILTKYHPKLVLINYREPDYSGHANSWSSYLAGIASTDEYISQIWQFIENDSIYNNKTTVFVTNDHGRHLDDVANGFVSHGDDCEGCRHINLYASGPDFKQGITVDNNRELIDIPATIGELLNLKMPTVQGEVMTELFK